MFNFAPYEFALAPETLDSYVAFWCIFKSHRFAHQGLKCTRKSNMQMNPNMMSTALKSNYVILGLASVEKL